MAQGRSQSYLASALSAILPRNQRRWHAVAYVVLAVLCADTLFLLAHRLLRGIDGWMASSVDFGRAPSRFYQAMVLSHSALGYILSFVLLVFVCMHLPSMLRRLRGRWWLAATGLTVVGLYGFLFYSGNYFLLHSKSTDKQWLYWSHMGLSAVFLAVYAGHRLFATKRMPKRQLASLAYASLAVAVVMTAGELAELALSPKPRIALANPALPRLAGTAGFAPASGVDPAAPFFPSPVTISSGAATINTDAIIGPTLPNMTADVHDEVTRKGFAQDRLIGAEGCGRCHADTVAQWSKSAHRFSSFNNPFYLASLDQLRTNNDTPNAFLKQHMDAYGFNEVKSGQIKSQWCAGCHDPALLFQGKMRAEIDPGIVKAQAGLTCLACHQINAVHGHTGNANYVWDDEFRDPYLFTEASGGVGTVIHDLYLKANPEQHRKDMLKPVFTEGSFCATCHKVSLEPALNDYRFVRGQDEYDNWYDSGAQLNAARTFYQPKQASECQTCHMPLEAAPLGDVAAKNGKVHSHRFLAVNTALPFLRGDTDTIHRIEDALRGKLRVTFAGLRDGNRVALATEEAKASLEIAGAKSPELDIVVRNVGVGHTFPGGTNDSNEGWIEITITDEAGSPLVRAGRIDEQGRVVENTRIYNTIFIDRFSNRIARRNAQDIAALVYAAVIPPSASDTVRFQIPAGAIPPDVHRVKVSARLLWRKFNRQFADFVRDAEPLAFANVSADLPTTEIAAASATMSIEPGDSGTAYTLEPVPNPLVASADRYLLTHDYGIGLLLQGDTVVARSVLEDLVRRHPECDNCMRTLARLQLQLRDYPAARATMTEHEKRWPGNAQGAWLWAGVLRGEGNDEEALKALKRMVEVYPRDREAWRLTAEIGYRAAHFQMAVDAAANLLDIDAEDPTGHYYAMLGKRALGDTAGAKLEETAYRYYQRDESAQQKTLDFRQHNPAANFAAQPIRVYDLQ